MWTALSARSALPVLLLLLLLLLLLSSQLDSAWGTGAVKFIGYHVLKKKLPDILTHHPYLASSLGAEIAATVLLTPFLICEVGQSLS